MTQITKKEFIETLSNNETILVDSLFRYNDRKCINAMEYAMERIITINKNVKRRTVTEEHSNYIVFSDGSRLDFNQTGTKKYFSYTNTYGFHFLIQRTEVYDDFDEQFYKNYIVYMVAQGGLIMFTVRYYPEDVAETLCLIAFDNPSRRTIMECTDGLLGLLATAKNSYNPEGYRVLYKVLETIVDVQEV